MANNYSLFLSSQGAYPWPWRASNAIGIRHALEVHQLGGAIAARGILRILLDADTRRRVLNGLIAESIGMLLYIYIYIYIPSGYL